MCEQNIIEKVKKLLQLSESKVNENEAAVAAMQAQKLMKKYDLSIGMVMEDKKSEDDIGYTQFSVNESKKWKFSLSNIVARNFRCKVFWIGRKTCCFYGHENDTNIATEVFKFLFKIGNKCANNMVYYYKVNHGFTKDVYKSFIIGYLNGLDKHLSENCKELSLYIEKEVVDKYEEFMSGNNKGKINSSIKPDGIVIDAYYKGVDKGREVMSRKGITEGNV